MKEGNDRTSKYVNWKKPVENEGCNGYLGVGSGDVGGRVVVSVLFVYCKLHVLKVRIM